MNRRRVTLRTEDGEVLHEGPEPWGVAPRGGRAGDQCFRDPMCARTRFHDGICAGVEVVGESDALEVNPWVAEVEPDPVREIIEAMQQFNSWEPWPSEWISNGSKARLG